MSRRVKRTVYKPNMLALRKALGMSIDRKVVATSEMPTKERKVIEMLRRNKPKEVRRQTPTFSTVAVEKERSKVLSYDGHRIFLTITLGNQPYEAFIDTGVTANFIAQPCTPYVCNPDDVRPCNKMAKMANGTEVEVSGEVDLEIKFGCETKLARFLVLPIEEDYVVLGLEFLEQMRATLQIGHYRVFTIPLTENIDASTSKPKQQQNETTGQSESLKRNSGDEQSYDEPTKKQRMEDQLEMALNSNNASTSKAAASCIETVVVDATSSTCATTAVSTKTILVDATSKTNKVTKLSTQAVFVDANLNTHKTTTRATQTTNIKVPFTTHKQISRSTETDEVDTITRYTQTVGNCKETALGTQTNQVGAMTRSTQTFKMEPTLNCSTQTEWSDVSSSTTEPLPHGQQPSMCQSNAVQSMCHRQTVSNIYAGSANDRDSVLSLRHPRSYSQPTNTYQMFGATNGVQQGREKVNPQHIHPQTPSVTPIYATPTLVNNYIQQPKQSDVQVTGGFTTNRAWLPIHEIPAGVMDIAKSIDWSSRKRKKIRMLREVDNVMYHIVVDPYLEPKVCLHKKQKAALMQ